MVIYENNKNGDNMDVINIFLFFSIIGHLIENIFNLGGSSGILYLYWTPVYGFGAVILYFLYQFIDKFKLNRIINFIVLFLSSFIVLSLIEHIGGVLLDILFNKTLWDYSKMKFNLGKYVCLEMSLLWSIGGISVYYLRPIFNKLMDYIPKWLTVILLIVFLGDVIITILTKAI